MSGHLTRRQHVVSAFYLREFANDRGQLRCAHRNGSDEFTASVNDTSVRSDFYSLTLEDGSKSGAFEGWMSEIEGAAAPVLAGILGGEEPPAPGDERMAVSGWIALQYLRGEAQRNMVSQLGDMVTAISRGSLNDFQREAGLALLGAPTGRQADPAAHLVVVRDVLPRLAALVLASPWCVSTFASDYLVTCDQPVNLMPNPRRPDEAALGLGNAYGLTVPLSRRVGLVAVTSQPRRAPADVVVVGSAAEARHLNLTTMLNARRAVYRHPEDPLPESMASFPEPQTLEVGFEVVSAPDVQPGRASRHD